MSETKVLSVDDPHQHSMLTSTTRPLDRSRGSYINSLSSNQRQSRMFKDSTPDKFQKHGPFKLNNIRLEERESCTT